MSWALNARRASLSEALHTVARLLPDKVHNISSNSNDDDLIIVTSNLKHQMGIILRNINELAETLASWTLETIRSSVRSSRGKH